MVTCNDFFSEEKHYFLVLEYMEGGELFDRIVKKSFYNEREARDLVCTLLSAIEYCHLHNIAHRWENTKNWNTKNTIISDHQFYVTYTLCHVHFMYGCNSATNSAIFLFFLILIYHFSRTLAITFSFPHSPTLFPSFLLSFFFLFFFIAFTLFFSSVNQKHQNKSLTSLTPLFSTYT